MASNFYRCLWLIEQLSPNKAKTFRELDKAWQNSWLNEYKEPLSRSSFNYHKETIARDFLLDIACEKGTHRYYFSNPQLLNQHPILAHLIHNSALANLLQMYQGLEDRIILEPTYSDERWLSLIAEAMQNNLRIEFVYRSFHSGGQLSKRKASPYGLRLFMKRWYLIADTGQESPYIYALDRIKDLYLSSETFKMPEDFSLNEYFRHCYGIIRSKENKPEELLLKVYGSQVLYLRTLPLHSSQEEIEIHESYSIFRYWLAPSYDLILALLSLGNTSEVINKGDIFYWLKHDLKHMLNRYEKQDESID